MIAVSCHFVFLALANLDFGSSINFLALFLTNGECQYLLCRPYTTISTAIVRGLCNPSEVHEVCCSIGRMSSIIATATYSQHLTLQADWIGILMLADERILHFLPAAKNTVAFFNLSCSICKQSTGAFSDLIFS